MLLIQKDDRLRRIGVQSSFFNLKLTVHGPGWEIVCGYDCLAIKMIAANLLGYG